MHWEMSMQACLLSEAVMLCERQSEMVSMLRSAANGCPLCAYVTNVNDESVCATLRAVQRLCQQLSHVSQYVGDCAGLNIY
jgi:hypothetical protein